MAVNYGLGGFEQGSAFFAAYNNSVQTITISAARTPTSIRTYTEVNLGQDAGDFSSNYHLVDFLQGKFTFKTTGIFLVSYNITTGNPSNNTIETSIMKNGTNQSAIQLGYCRSGDFFEVGSQGLIYANSDDYIDIQVANTDGTDDIEIHNINVSIIKLKYGGRING